MRSLSGRTWAGLLVWLLVFGSTGAHAQVLTVGDPLDAYARLLQLSGALKGPSLMVRPVETAQVVREVEPGVAHPWERIIERYRQPSSSAEAAFEAGGFDPVVQGYWNSTRPGGANDGAVWQGVGGTVAASAGGYLRYGILSVAFRPQLIYSQNKDTDLFPNPLVLDRRSPFAHQRRDDIDLPQRFGAESFNTFDWGQSYIRLDYKGVAVGFSHENMWWGPAVRNPIIMSNNAPGFRHTFIGTSRPVNVGIGRLEGKWLWGRLTESDYFDFDDANDRRYLTALSLAFQPKGVPGLYLGTANTLMVRHDERLRVRRDYFGAFENPYRDHGQWKPGESDRMVSLFARYVLPKSGLETYFEWAHGDSSLSFRDFFVQPDHGRAYTVGLQKLFKASPRVFMVFGIEHSVLEAVRQIGERNTSPAGKTYFYVHEGIKQGYTQLGQIVGAGIGPGGNGQTLHVSLYAPFGSISLSGFRTVYDNDRYYQQPMDWNPHLLHEVEFGGGLSGMLFFKGFELSSGFTYGRFLNRYWLYKNDHTNVNMTVSLRRSFGGYR